MQFKTIRFNSKQLDTIFTGAQDLLWFALFLGILNISDHVIKHIHLKRAKPPGPPQTQVIHI